MLVRIPAGLRLICRSTPTIAPQNTAVQTCSQKEFESSLRRSMLQGIIGDFQYHVK
jgi:hypothetical protein